MYKRQVPSPEEFRERIAHTLEKYPYLVAEHDGKIVGYAYVSPFKERAAYAWAVETSIYVDQNCNCLLYTSTRESKEKSSDSMDKE